MLSLKIKLSGYNSLLDIGNRSIFKEIIVQMKGKFLKQFLLYMRTLFVFLLAKSWSGIKWFFRNPTFWSGLIPTVLLALGAYYGLYQANRQLTLLHEQISYLRQPVLNIFLREKKDGHFGLSLANIGNDTLENVRVRMGLFLLNDKEIYTYGEMEHLPSYWGFIPPRPPKENTWPRLTLVPNDEFDLTDRINSLTWFQVFYNPKEGEKEATHELFSVKELFKSDYVLFIEYTYRRKSDFVQYSDTAYFHYDPVVGMHTDLKLEIGGLRLIERLKSYMQSGPEIFLKIRDDRYEIFRNTFGSYPEIIKIIPRKKHIGK